MGLTENLALQDAPSNLAVLGRHILSPKIFDLIENLQPGLGGEIQLMDAISKLLSFEGLNAMKTDAEVYYGGNKYGYLSANLAVGMQASKSKAILNVLFNKLNDDNI